VLGVEKLVKEESSGHRFLECVVEHQLLTCGSGLQGVDLTGVYSESEKRYGSDIKGWDVVGNRLRAIVRQFP